MTEIITAVLFVLLFFLGLLAGYAKGRSDEFKSIYKHLTPEEKDYFSTITGRTSDRIIQNGKSFEER